MTADQNSDKIMHHITFVVATVGDWVNGCNAQFSQKL